MSLKKYQTIRYKGYILNIPIRRNGYGWIGSAYIEDRIQEEDGAFTRVGGTKKNLIENLKEEIDERV